MTTRVCHRAALVLLVLLSPHAALLAQTGRIAGTVRDSTGRAIPGALVSMVGASPVAVTDATGRFYLDRLLEGTYDLRIRSIGRPVREVSHVVVRSNEETRVDEMLGAVPTRLEAVVVSASRTSERITDAPAVVTLLGQSSIEQTAGGNSFLGVMSNARGFDFIQTGVTAIAVNARGFNSSFNNRVLLVEDGRIAVIPEKGLPLGRLSSIARVDLASVEAIAGPGAALYGPDASNGVITLQTRDPRSEPGLTIEATGGNRRYRDVQGRYAVVLGDLGLKASGEYQSAADFQNYLNYGPVAPSTSRTPEAPIDWHTVSRRGSASAVYYRGEQRLELNGGFSDTDGLEQTSAGRNQLVGYRVRHLQVRYGSRHLFANGYQLRTDAGKTFGTNAFSQNRVAFPALSPDSIRALSDFPGRGLLSAGELQGNSALPFLADARVVMGIQLRRDQVTSDRQWLSDRKTGRDIVIDQVGVYGQIEDRLPRGLRLVAAARYDEHQRYGKQVSPKAALLWSPRKAHVVRVSVNRAYKAPTIPNMDFYSPNLSRLGPGLGIGMFGNQGFTVRNASGQILERYDPIAPEVNTTYEVGYKGVFGDRLFLDIAAYRSAFRNFLTPLTTINNPARPAAQGGPTYAFDLSGQKIVAPDGSEQIVLTYLNVGRATLVGGDVGIRYDMGSRLGGNINYSTTALSGLHLAPNQTTLRDATSLNSPKHKFAATIDSRFGAHWSEWLSVRGVTGYDYRSGAINTGRIAGFSTADVGASRELGSPNVQLRVSLLNFVSCSGGRYVLPITVPPPGVFMAKRRCGFGITHQELINMPAIGPMMFLTIRVTE